jgi:L-gulonate 3-dehydrogenase
MTIEKAAVVGGGIIGRSWAVVFARAGVPVTVYDHLLEGRAAMPARFADMAAESGALCGDAAAQAATLARITVVDNIAKAVTEADFIHECIDEKLDSKRAIFLELNRLAKSSAILATTTLSFPVSTFASELPGRSRCIVVHPATPPHLLPVTEICPAPFTDQAVTHASFAFMERCKQAPVLIRFEQSNFVLNLLQAGLVVEMLRCSTAASSWPETSTRSSARASGCAGLSSAPSKASTSTRPGASATISRALASSSTTWPSRTATTAQW